MLRLRPMLLLIGIVAATLYGWTAAQAHRSKPVRPVAPFATGGTTNLLARIIAGKMAPARGHTVIVEGKAGAGGAIGAAEIAKAPPEGYGLPMSSVSAMVTNLASNTATPYDAVKDFVHTCNDAATPNVIAVQPSFPAKHYKARYDALLKNPGKAGMTCYRSRADGQPPGTGEPPT